MSQSKEGKTSAPEGAAAHNDQQTSLSNFLEQLSERQPHQPEFLEAVQEVMQATAKGANVAAFHRIAEAMLNLGPA